MKHIRKKENTFQDTRLKPIPSITFYEEQNKIVIFKGPQDFEVTLYFNSMKMSYEETELKLWDNSVSTITDVKIFNGDVDVTGFLIIDDMNDSYAKIPCNKVKTNSDGYYELTIKSSNLGMNGGFLYSSFAEIIDYPKNIGQNYMGAFGRCPNLRQIRFMNELPTEISIDKFPDAIYAGQKGKLYYNSKYDYSQIINNLQEGWEAVPV